MGLAYYNEIDPFAAEWLRQLIKAGHIAPGVVDERDIRDVLPSELSEYTQCHFFAGIGVWSYALREAGWPDDRPVWTGSCPCQPFSSSGRKKGVDDERHLWPHWFYLITQRRPNVIFGEQVASKDGLAWLDTVQSDLEAMGHACGAVPFPSASIGAPHQRERTYFVAHDNKSGRNQGSGDSREKSPTQSQTGHDTERSGDIHILANSSGQRWDRGWADQKSDKPPTVERPERPCAISPLAQPQSIREARGPKEFIEEVGGPSADVMRQPCKSSGVSRIMGDANNAGPQGHSRNECDRSRRSFEARPATPPSILNPALPGPVNGFWRNADWIGCTDGKFRAVEPGTFPLVDGAPARVGRLRGYGNALNQEQAKIFIEAYLG